MQTTNQPIIELQGVTKIYKPKKHQEVPALKSVNLCIEPGEFAIITGRSGCGKTTLLNLVSGLTRPTSGKVLLEQVEVWRLPDARQAALRNQKIGFIFQFPSLMPSLTALENVILPTIAGQKRNGVSLTDRAASLLGEVGLADKLDAYPRQLSAGQQQRVVVARSLINHPDVLLADEPTSNLDEHTEHEIMALVQNIHLKHNITILLVTHTEELVPYGNRTIRMSEGQIVNQALVSRSFST